MADGGIVRLDLHGKTVYQARVAINAALRRRAGAARLRLIHGSSRGTAIRDMIWQEYPGAPGVLRLAEISADITDLVLKEM